MNIILHAADNFCRKNIYFLFTFFFLVTLTLNAQVKAFPTAYGGGSNASGGRGGNVYHVTNLLDDGSEGSFRWALQQPRPATIVFDVSGVIKVSSWLDIFGEDLTIAGQSAPQGGITFSTNGETQRFRLRDYANGIARNIIMRYLRFKPIAEDGNDSFEIFNDNGGYDIIIDHCEVAYGGDEGFSIRGVDSYNITFQRSILAENKTGSLFGDSNQALRPSYNLSWINNLSFNNSHRSPNITTDGQFEIINNIIHNWEDHLGATYGNYEGNIINNYFSLGQRENVNGPESIARRQGWSLSDDFNPSLYIAGNVSDKSDFTDPDADNWGLVWEWYSPEIGPNAYREEQADEAFRSFTPFPLLGNPLPIQTALEAYEDVRTNVGANAYLNADGSAGYFVDLPTSEYLDVIATEGDFIEYSQFDQNTPYDYNPTFDIYKQYIIDFDPNTPINTRPANYYNPAKSEHIPEAFYDLYMPEGASHNDIAPSGYTWLEEYLNGVDFFDNAGEPVNAGEDRTICEGETVTLTATGANSYEWSTGETTASINVSPSVTTTYTVTGTSGTTITTDDVQVFVNEVPIADAGNDETICFGSSITLTANGGVDYLWNTGETTQSITVSPDDTTTYTVTVINSNGCEAEDDVQVIVNPLPTANAGSNVMIMQGDAITLTASGGGTYLWSTGETTQSITVGPNVTTTYTVTVNVDGCQDSDDVEVTVVDEVIANAGEDQTICEGESVTLTASGGNTYVWSTGETTQSITVNPLDTTTYTVTAIIGTFSDTDDVQVFVNELPVADAGSDETICFGSSITLTANGGVSYLWNTGETTQSITVSPDDTTTYTVTVTNSNGCEAEDDVLVTVNPLPTANAGSDTTIMQGDVVTLTASGGGTYLWSTGETTQSITVGPNVTTTYTVTVNVNGCQDSDDVEVTVVEEIIANAGEDQTICEGESVTLTASGGTTYVWSTGETTQSITVNPIDTTTYTVTAIIGAFSDTDDVTVFVNSLPDANAGTDVTINEGESTVLTASGGDSYEWSTGETTQSITVNPTVDTTYTVFVSSNGCDNFDEVEVFVNPAAQADAGEDQTICQGSEVILTATGGDNYVWSTGETTQSITVSPMSTSNYSVIVSNDFSSDTDEVTVIVNPLPNVQVSGDVSILEGEFVTLSATGANTYEWSNGATLPNIAVSPSETTTYQVTGYINDCSETESLTVTVFEEVVANAGQDVSMCFGETITLSASGGDSYVWSTGETSQTIQVSPAEDTVYTVIASNEMDSDTDEVSVAVTNCGIGDDEPEDTSLQGYDYQLYISQNNPDILNVKLSGLEGDVDVLIHDLNGKLLYRERFDDNNGQNFRKQINISNYNKSVYLVTLAERNRSTTKRVVFH